MKERHHLRCCSLLGLNSCLHTGDESLRTAIRLSLLGKINASGWAEDPVTKNNAGLGTAHITGETGRDSLRR